MDVVNGSTTKTSWEDDVDDFDTPRSEESISPDGTRTVIEYATNEEGKKIKITRKIEQTLTESTVDPVVAARKSWAKFGADRGKSAGPDRATTTVGEDVVLELVAGGQKTEPEAEAESDLKKQLENKKITCRLCKGAHFTSKCPYRDTLGMDEEDTPLRGVTPNNEPASVVTGCFGIRRPPDVGGSTYRWATNRDDMPTLRVKNVSEETDENDLRDLFGRFGRVLRVYIGRDRDTGISKGYAFVSFEDKADAERAIQKTNGMDYDNLILSVSWARPREQR